MSKSAWSSIVISARWYSSLDVHVQVCGSGASNFNRYCSLGAIDMKNGGWIAFAILGQYLLRVRGSGSPAQNAHGVWSGAERPYSKAGDPAGGRWAKTS